MTIPPIRPVPPDGNRPLWSVMIPTYRPHVGLLREALAGPLAAWLGREHMQIGLVDDGSGPEPAGTSLRELAEEYQDRVEFHPFDVNLGLAPNWNRCLDLSRGQLVHILHQDDRVRPDFYNAVAAGFDTEPTIGAAFTQVAFINGAGDFVHNGYLRRDEAGILHDWLEHVFSNLAIQCPAMVVRRVVYERLGGFDESYKYSCDREMWQRIAMAYPLWFDPRPLAQYRQHDMSASWEPARRPLLWSELHRCTKEGAGSISPPARRAALRSFRRHTLRVVRTSIGQAIDKRDWRGVLAHCRGAALFARPSDVAAVIRGRHTEAPPSRAPDRPDDLTAERNPRILLLTEFLPWSRDSVAHGACQRLGHALHALSRLGPIDVALLRTDLQPWTDDGNAHLKSIAAEIWPRGTVLHMVASGVAANWRARLLDFFWSLRGFVGFDDAPPNIRCYPGTQIKSLERILRHTQPDLVVAHRLNTAVRLLRVKSELPPMVVDLDDLEDVRFQRMARARRDLAGKSVAWRAALLARRMQRRVGAKAAALLVCSPLDRDKLQSVCANARVVVVPNAATALGPLPPASEPVAVFLGTARYQPNVDAILWLVGDIWPRVRRAVPHARLIIAGERTDALGVSAPQLDIEIRGFVHDLTPIYASAMLAVCPIRRGVGTRIKIIEASINGRPTVSTTIGAEGLVFKSGRDILLEDDSDGFAAACIALLRDPTLAARIGGAAQKSARAAYHESGVVDRWHVVFADALRRGSAPHQARSDAFGVLAAVQGGEES